MTQHIDYIAENQQEELFYVLGRVEAYLAILDSLAETKGDHYITNKEVSEMARVMLGAIDKKYKKETQSDNLTIQIPDDIAKRIMEI